MKLIDLLMRELPKRGGWPDGAEKYCSYNGEAGAYKPGGIEIKKALITGIDTQICDVVYAGQYEAALAAKNDGWIEWDGGECPVKSGDIFDVRDRHGYEYLGCNLNSLCAQNWSVRNSGYDIIAYRPHKPDINSRTNDDRLEQDLNECIGHDVDVPEWNGDWVPPIGCACEMQDSKGTWLPVEIIAKNDGFTFGWSYDYRIVFFGDKADEFRPLRTEAERKRDEAAKAMARAANDDPQRMGDASVRNCMSIYDAIAAGKIPGVKLED